MKHDRYLGRALTGSEALPVEILTASFALGGQVIGCVNGALQVHPASCSHRNHLCVSLARTLWQRHLSNQVLHSTFTPVLRNRSVHLWNHSSISPGWSTNKANHTTPPLTTWLLELLPCTKFLSFWVRVRVHITHGTPCSDLFFYIFGCSFLVKSSEVYSLVPSSLPPITFSLTSSSSPGFLQ